MRKHLFVLLAGVLFFVSIGISTPLLARAKGNVLEGFLNPSRDERPMVRMWFPDAGAGLDEYDTIEKQILELARAGFGGVEVAMLADGSELTNEEVRIVGWGTEAWRELLKKVLRAAKKVEGGFRVDITITAHWPAIVSCIDPNDDAASQELSYSYVKVTPEDLQNTSYVLPLPEKKLFDGKNAPFIFVDKLVSAALVKVMGKKEIVEEEPQPFLPFMPAKKQKFEYVLDFDSIIPLTDVVQIYGHAAGVPDKEALQKYYGDSGTTYDDVVKLFGEEPAPDADLSGSFNGKMDSKGNRARMADVQYYYQVDLSKYAALLSGYTPSKGDDIKPGDWILVSVYRRGTGQVQSGPGSVLMYGRTYCVDYFDESGAQAIIYTWEKNVLDGELRELLKENKGSIFEDSIEVSTSSSLWSHDLLEELRDDYPFKQQMPLVVALGPSSFDRKELADRIKEDYEQLLGHLYNTQHLEPLKKWASTFSYTYRAQAYGLEGVDESFSATVVDIPEGDNGTKGDGLRRLFGSVNVANKEFLSMEAITGWDNLRVNWADIIAELNQNYSHGVNRAILHGSPYNKTWNGYQADWPGWLAFSMLFGPFAENPRFFADTYHYRQIYWEDMPLLGNYMARVQSILQRGTPKIDLAVISSSQSGNSLQLLLDHGYSYNILSDALITGLENVMVSNGRLCESGPAYKALILHDVSKVSADAVRKLIEFAKSGLPIILLNSELETVPGTWKTGNSDSEMKALFAQLKTLPGVYAAFSEKEVLNILERLSIFPDASYHQPQLEATHYVDEKTGSDYYYLYNNTYPENLGMIMTPSHASNFKSGKAIETVVTLKGSGKPYILDAWTGKITPIVEYRRRGDEVVSVEISLSAGEAIIVGLLKEEDVKFWSSLSGLRAPDMQVVGKTGGEVRYENGKVLFRCNEPGTYAVVFSDGSVRSFTAQKMLNKFDLSNLSWSLELKSFGPDRSEENIQDPIVPPEVLNTANKYTLYKDPSTHKVTTLKFENIKLCSWKDLPATREQLDVLGVESMEYVSGIGYYAATFTLPEEWTSAEGKVGAILELKYSQDQVTEIAVNGHVIKAVNCISDKVDIGDYLVSGENTITIKLCSTLYNRARREYSLYRGLKTSYNETGLLSVVLHPYFQFEVTE
ncbi:MAG: hypothetical protein H5U36_02260 [Candidatus Caldatribacterium sp.]|nr:hypothetical protein [Candidatus Caldatribacterium sp.]